MITALNGTDRLEVAVGRIDRAEVMTDADQGIGATRKCTTRAANCDAISDNDLSLQDSTIGHGEEMNACITSTWEFLLAMDDYPLSAITHCVRESILLITVMRDNKMCATVSMIIEQGE